MKQQADLWTALRERGIDADDPEIRAAVRAVLATVDDVGRRVDHYHARRCAEAMQVALAYQLQHPKTSDMSRFEDEFEEGER
jgi:hypothetical protein